MPIRDNFRTSSTATTYCRRNSAEHQAWQRIYYGAHLPLDRDGRVVVRHADWWTNPLRMTREDWDLLGRELNIDFSRQVAGVPYRAKYKPENIVDPLPLPG